MGKGAGKTYQGVTLERELVLHILQEDDQAGIPVVVPVHEQVVAEGEGIFELLFEFCFLQESPG